MTGVGSSTTRSCPPSPDAIVKLDELRPPSRRGRCGALQCPRLGVPPVQQSTAPFISHRHHVRTLPKELRMTSSHPRATGGSSSPPPETLEGEIIRVTFYNPQTGHTIAAVQVKGHPAPITVLGKLPDVQPGEGVRLEGTWTVHPVYGRQFAASRCATGRPGTAEAMRRYLGSGMVPGLGLVLAERLVNHFGASVLDVLDHEPGRVAEVPGIGAKRTAWLREAWAEHRALRDIIQFLSEHGINTLYAQRIAQTFGPGALAILRANPYRLAQEVPAVGFAAADALTRRSRNASARWRGSRAASRHRRRPHVSPARSARRGGATGPEPGCAGHDRGGCPAAPHRWAHARAAGLSGRCESCSRCRSPCHCGHAAQWPGRARVRGGATRPRARPNVSPLSARLLADRGVAGGAAARRRGSDAVRGSGARARVAGALVRPRRAGAGCGTGAGGAAGGDVWVAGVDRGPGQREDDHAAGSGWRAAGDAPVGAARGPHWQGGEAHGRGDRPGGANAPPLARGTARQSFRARRDQSAAGGRAGGG